MILRYCQALFCVRGSKNEGVSAPQKHCSSNYETTIVHMQQDLKLEKQNLVHVWWPWEVALVDRASPCFREKLKSVQMPLKASLTCQATPSFFNVAREKSGRAWYLKSRAWHHDDVTTEAEKVTRMAGRCELSRQHGCSISSSLRL